MNLALAAARLGDWSWDAATDMVTFSARAAEIFGIPAGPHMTWTAMRELIHPQDRERARLAVERSILEHENYSIEYRLVNGGRERWVFASGRATYDGRGRVLGMFGVVQDITSDRLLLRLDDAVRPLVKPEDITYTAARLLGQYLDVHRCAYAVVEDDQDTFSLVGNYTNGAPSIVGRYRFREFGEDCLRLLRAGLVHIIEDTQADPSIDAQARQAYALAAVRSAVCVPILKSGRLVAVMAVQMQVPRCWSAAEVELVQKVASRCWESIERARVERERESLLQAAEAANRAKDEFLAMLGHELRNPLAPILTALQLMKLRDDPGSARERDVIERQVTHLTRLIDDLLDVSRIARGKVVLECEVVELAELVDRAVEVVSPLLEQRSQVLQLELQRNGLPVEVDAARLTQVICNLLTNAVKYTPPGGRISIAAELAASDVVLRVRDTGIGMSADALPGIFDMFVQGRQSIDRAQGGLGLGLAIVRSLVERHGGSVSAHSEGLELGSEFVVRLPLACPPAPGVAAAGRDRRPSAHAERSGIRILVVDDNEDAAEMFAMALSMQGHEVEVAHDGPQALNLAAARRFDAALLDIGLPVMDGYELAARLKDLPTLRHARLIAITGYGQKSDRRRALEAGFHHHLVKPVALDVVAQILRGASPHEA